MQRCQKKPGSASNRVGLTLRSAVFRKFRLRAARKLSTIRPPIIEPQEELGIASPLSCSTSVAISAMTIGSSFNLNPRLQIHSYSDLIHGLEVADIGTDQLDEEFSCASVRVEEHFHARSTVLCSLAPIHRHFSTIGGETQSGTETEAIKVGRGALRVLLDGDAATRSIDCVSCSNHLSSRSTANLFILSTDLILSK